MVWLQGRVLHDSVHTDRRLCLYIYFNASRNVFLAARVGGCCFAVVHLVEEAQPSELHQIVETQLPWNL